MVPRRSIDDLLARYRLEPRLRDLYVEGVADRALYSWYLDGIGISSVAVYPIEAVDVNSVALCLHGFDGGHRNRVLALALELDRGFSDVLSGVRCIADSDYDFLVGRSCCSGHLLYTDYTSVELYAWDQSCLQKVFMLTFRGSQADLLQFWNSASIVLREGFLLRAANNLLKWEMRLPRLISCCEVSGSTIKFDWADYLGRLLQSAGRWHDRERFVRVVERLRLKEVADVRQCMSGEDFLELLGWYCRKRWGWDGYRRDARSARALLFPSVELSALSSENLFMALQKIYG